MALVGFRAQNHPQQFHGSAIARGAADEVDDRGTDPKYFYPWNERFGPFTLDVAASAENTKVARFFTRDDDGLVQSWAGERVWCNPPYSDIFRWVEKAWFEHLGTRGIVMLLPANRTEQRWWQQLIEPFRDRGGAACRWSSCRGG